jgi:hypothetical protein
MDQVATPAWQTTREVVRAGRRLRLDGCAGARAETSPEGT